MMTAISSCLRSLRSKIQTTACRLDPIRLLILGYLSYALAGWGLLSLPVCHQTAGVTPLDHLFISASAVSTTGLATISTADSYSWWGELTVLLLIQFGGLGYMTISSFTIQAVTGGISPLRDRVTRTTLALPQGFEVRRFLAVTCWFTLAIEPAGAAALYPSFAAHHAPAPVWQAVFHSVSAFCTAGFGLFNNSMEDYRGDMWINLTLLSYLGAIGFIVLHDVWTSLCHRRPRVTLTTKIILWSTLWISVIGTVLFALDEPTVQSLPTSERWMASLFQVMSASTTVGCNTIPLAPVSSSTLFLLSVVMIISASPSGTGSGLKTTTFSAVWAEMVSVVRRPSVTTFLGLATAARMRAAVASLVFYLLVLTAGIYVLAVVEQSPLPDLAFECASVLGTVGLSRSITGALTPAGK